MSKFSYEEKVRAVQLVEAGKHLDVCPGKQASAIKSSESTSAMSKIWTREPKPTQI